MERLTERELNSVNNVSYCKCFFKGCNGQCATCDLQYEADMKLKEYEDLEEQGLLLRLPVKAGQKVWIVFKDNIIEEHTVAWIKLGEVNDTIYFEDDCCYSVWNKNYDDFKKWVFLTKEEAEAKLKELENE